MASKFSVMIRFCLCFLLLLLWPFTLLRSQNTSLNASEILLGLQKLNTVGSVLYIAAHPDDENTRLLAYLANEKKVRTGYLSLTRGDGGQNLVGKEQGEALGLIRTQELLAARRIDGAEQFFTRANDFGFSKNPEETFSFWNKDSILADVVLAIRRFKPDVIICRFPTTGEGGHGHHTASAILALEAFDAAADPKRYPEQLSVVQVWQTKRIFWNTFNFGGTNTTSPDQLKLDVGGYNVLLGKNYGEIASESRSCHKSQGFGTAKQRGSNIEYFKLLKGDSAKKDLFDKIDLSWNRLKGQEKLQKLIENCTIKYNPVSPENSLPALTEIYKYIQSLNENDPLLKYWKQQKLKETETLLLACAGLWMEANASHYTGIPGEEISLTVQIIARNKCDGKLNRITYLQSDTVMALPLNTNELFTYKRKEKLPMSFPYSNPYWLNAPHGVGTYHVSDFSLIGKPENPPASRVMFDLSLGGLNLKIERPLVYKWSDPVKGEVYRPFEVLPPATVNLPEKVFMFTGAQSKTIALVVKANTANVTGTLSVKASEGWNITVKDPVFKLTVRGDEAVINVVVTSSKDTKDGKLSASLIIDNNNYTKSIKRIEYDHIPYQFILSEADARLVNTDLKKTGTDIGYIPGAGDDIPSCLKQVGYNVTVLSDELLATEDLSKYQAIVTGIRAYNTSDRLQVHYAKLMDYIKKGGNLIVQYNTNNRIGPVLAKIGPYPFTISRDRVTDEKAEVKFTSEKHPALSYPNTITSKDFENWIQERGIYFATEPDKNYETILSMNDPGEKSSSGSLIIAKYGKGNFVYTGLVFFRELPAGVPGAYRLFVNLLSLPQNKS